MPNEIYLSYQRDAPPRLPYKVKFKFIPGDGGPNGLLDVLADPPMVLFLKVTNGDKPGATAHGKFITCKKIKQQQNYQSCETVIPIHRVHILHLPAS